VAGQPPDPAAVVESCLLREMAGRGVPGAAVAVLRDGQVVFERGYGVKRQDDPAATVGTATQFRIGSSTKTFTAAGLLRLVDRGLVDLDAPLSRYVPEARFAEPGFEDRVTIRDLLRHTSGLPDNSATGEADLYQRPDPAAMGRWVLAQSATRPQYPPGRFYNYSSANYIYAGHVIERVSGTGYPEYMRREVFQPAGLASTTLVASEVEARGDFAFGHWRDIFHGQALRIWRPSDQDNWARHPTGYIHTTPGDVVRFLDLLMNDGGGLLTPASAALMQSPLADTRERAAGRHYGFGVLSETYGSLSLKHHAGSAWGWMSAMKWVPERRFAVSVLSNGFAGLEDTADCAVDAYLRPAPAADPPCPRSPERWASWTGHYEGTTFVGDSWVVDVRRRPSGEIDLALALPGRAPSVTTLGQSCGEARDRGPDSFAIDTDASGGVDQVITFVDDPVEPGVAWIRHRLFVLRRGAPRAPAVFLPWASAGPAGE